MSAPFLATITLLGGGGAQPKGASTHLAMITPLSGEHPGHDLPGGPGGPVDPGWGVTPPVDPGYGRPSWGPVDPGYGRPQPLPPGVLPEPPVPPPPYADQMIVAVYKPGEGWKIQAYPEYPSHALPGTPAPKPVG